MEAVPTGIAEYSNGNCFCRVPISQMKMIKSKLRGRLGEANLSHLRKITIESPETSSSEELDQIVDVWIRKPRIIAIKF